jgi:dynein heavy chain
MHALTINARAHAHTTTATALRKTRLYLQTKLANPHYKPEIAAQCTLVNFCVTEKVTAGSIQHSTPHHKPISQNFTTPHNNATQSHSPNHPHPSKPPPQKKQGLEDQLLALVVNHERPDLQEQAAALVSQLGRYTITLKELEDSLLARLANAQVCVCVCVGGV